MARVMIDDRWLKDAPDGTPPSRTARASLARARDPLTASVDEKWRTKAYGEGSRWRVRWYTMSNDGVKRQHAKKFPNLEDAQAYAASVEADLRKGVYHDERLGRRPLAQVAEAWLDSKLDLRGSTARRYRRELDNHVLPAFGAMPVANVTRERVQEWVGKLADGSADTVRRPLAARSIRNIVKVVLGGVLDYAVDAGLIVANPVVKVTVPRIVRRDDDMVFLSVEEIEDLAREAGELGTVVDRTLVEFLAYVGVRIGEATALEVRDIDWSRGRVRIARTWTVDRDGVEVLGPPKSGKARWAAVPQSLMVPLARLCEGRDGEDWVFRAKRGGQVHLHNWRTRVWYPIVRACGLEDTGVTIHSLRHTYASLAIAAGADVKTLQSQLGHASATITLDTYAALWPERLGEVAAAVDAMRSRVVV